MGWKLFDADAYRREDRLCVKKTNHPSLSSSSRCLPSHQQLMTLFFFSYPPHTQVSAHINEPERKSARDPQSLTQLSKRQPRGGRASQRKKKMMMMTLLNGKTRRMGETLDACGMLTIYTKSIQAHPSSLSLHIGRVARASAPFCR
jgi:hypothetical protein